MDWKVFSLVLLSKDAKTRRGTYMVKHWRNFLPFSLITQLIGSRWVLAECWVSKSRNLSHLTLQKSFINALLSCRPLDDRPIIVARTRLTTRCAHTQLTEWVSQRNYDKPTPKYFITPYPASADLRPSAIGPRSPMGLLATSCKLRPEAPSAAFTFWL